MKKNKKRATQKRIEKRREQRGKRKQQGRQEGRQEGRSSGIGPVYRSAAGTRAWITDAMAMAVSGQAAVAVLVQESARSWLIGTRLSLLDGGYLGTNDVRVPGAVAPEDIGRRLFGAEHEVWGRYLRPAPISLAARLVWGAVAYSVSRGMRDDLGALPAMGQLPPPPGEPSAWLADFVRRFEISQVAMADAYLAEHLWLQGQGEPGQAGPGAQAAGQREPLPGSFLELAPRLPELIPELSSELIIEIELETETPLHACAAFDRHAAEFVPFSAGGAATAWIWMPMPARILDLAPRQARGVLWLDPSGRLLVRVLASWQGHEAWGARARGASPSAASELVMQLRAMVPSLYLGACRWHWPADDMGPEEDVLLLDEDDALIPESTLLFHP